ncbi:MAG: hypothetical protein HZB11_01045 [Candidatus Yonathbacteria bacterium]|nr:hypothetical protein [Candidatus Yonathbacteria bacterium]
MQIITVAPIVRGALKSALTYFSKEPIAAGMVVVAPVRTREVPAIVLESREASSAKSALKSYDYAIRKIMRAKPRRIWLPEFLKSAEETANFSAQKFGETLLAITPKTILDAHLQGALAEPQEFIRKYRFEILAIQSGTRARYDAYKRLVRESFARGESVFICVPTEDDAMRASSALGHGIENYTFTFHGGVTKKRILLYWQNAAKEKHAVLVVGTAQYLGLPRYFKTIVLEEEHSNAWKTMSRPLLDLRIFVEGYARACDSTFIMGGAILRAETHERIKNGTIGKFDRISARAESDTKTILIDPRLEEKSVRENEGKKGMIVLSMEARALIQNASECSEKVFLLAARKGLAGVTSCGDCGTLIKCPKCDTPLVIHKKESGSNQAQIFICHGCGYTRVPENNVHETCPNCGGWKLQGVGVGIERVSDEVARLFPDTPRFVLDGDHAKTRAQAKKIIAQFEKSRGGILIGTPMAIPLLETVSRAIIVSIDSLFAIPDIRMSERIFALVLVLREKTEKTLVIQTRADDTTIFKQALTGNLLDFTENELALRKVFSYPPYGTIIKITLRGKRADIAPEMERLKIFLKDYALVIPGTLAKEPKNIFRMHMILKLAEGMWPDSALLKKLHALPPQFTIEVNPDHLL